MKRTIAILTLLAAGAVFQNLVAEDVPLVDIVKAEAEIAQLDKDMETLGAENDKLAADSKDQQAGIDNSQAELKELLAVIDGMRYKAIEFKDFRLTIRDDKLLAKVNEMLAKMDAAIATSSERRNTIKKENDGRAEKIKSNTTKLDLNKRAIDRMNSRKLSLQASIARTKAQDARFQDEIAQVEAILAKSGSAAPKK
jgi:chromosome segregation ATPase